MKLQRNSIFIPVCMLALLVNCVGVFAQEKVKERKARQQVVIEQSATGAGEMQIRAFPRGHEGPGDGDTFIFVSGEMSFDINPIKGAPYSAEAVTETIQSLSDGNRIVRKTSASVYRDSEGRTRRDQTLGAIGPWATAGDPPQTFFINDPVAGVNYILDPKSQTARKLPAPRIMNLKPGEGAEKIMIERAEMDKSEHQMRMRRSHEPGADFTVVTGEPGTFSAMRVPPGTEKEKTESLGKQTVEGVEAEGTRTTITIPAGTIGNEAPINIVTERWYSPELQTVVMRKHSDPRVGETVYRLTNINRSEPARSLFEVPAGYTVKEVPSGGRVWTKKIEKNQ
ncbi:MAG TPA: hypothetical protein VNH22_06445 [Blastocatellia bacterium]|nr:hypothetical protein [Blastocatellia bacterium]